jgi:hypothetical protein
MSIALLVLVAWGGVMAVLVVAVVLIARRRGQAGATYPSCPQCGYDVTGTLGQSANCPECGVAFATVGIRPPQPARRSRWLLPMLVLAGCVMFVLVLGFIVALRGEVQAQAQQAAAIRAAAAAAAAQQQQAVQGANVPPATAPLPSADAP